MSHDVCVCVGGSRCANVFLLIAFFHKLFISPGAETLYGEFGGGIKIIIILIIEALGSISGLGFSAQRK